MIIKEIIQTLEEQPTLKALMQEAITATPEQIRKCKDYIERIQNEDFRGGVP